MSVTHLSSCGSGSTGLLLLDNNSDYNSFQMTSVPYNLVNISSSGVISASIDTEENCYFWTESISKLIKKNVKKVSCGWSHVLLLCTEDVYSYGKGSHGQLGLENLNETLEPVGLSIHNSTNIGCGFRTSFIVNNNITYVFGENQKYQLGLGHKMPIKVPTINSYFEGCNLEDITGGNKHSISFKGDSLYVWGSNSFGQLGIPELEARVPKEIKFSERIKKIMCGWNYVAVLGISGKVYMSGKGDLGQQGNGEYANCKNFNVVIENAEDAASGSEHVLVIRGRRLFAWGWNEHGNLGTGDNDNRCIPTYVCDNVNNIYAGGAVSYIVKSDVY